MTPSEICLWGFLCGIIEGADPGQYVPVKGPPGKPDAHYAFFPATRSFTAIQGWPEIDHVLRAAGWREIRP